jgi:hypothetical protein
MAKDSLLKEVDNALRWQRVQQLWQQSSRQIIVIIGLAVITLSALLFYQQQQRDDAQMASDALLRLAFVETKDTDITPTSGPLGELGLLLQARDALQANDTPQATELVSDITDAAATPNSVIKDYSCFLQNAQQVSDKTIAPECNAGMFAPMTTEFKLVTLLAEGDNQAAQLLLGEAGQNEPARITMLRAYVRSHSEAPAPAQESSDENAAP